MRMSWRLFKLQKYLIFLLFASFLLGLLLGIGLVTDVELPSGIFHVSKKEPPHHLPRIPTISKHHNHSQHREEFRQIHHDALLSIKESKIKKNLFSVMQEDGKPPELSPPKKKQVADISDADDDDDNIFDEKKQNYPPPNYDVHVFYYPWYGSPDIDGRYLHWNHEYMPHWDKKKTKRWPTGHHVPPDDIGASFYPALGSYSSRDPDVMHNHMQQIRTAGIGVLAVSWYPPDEADQQGHPWDDFMPQLMDIAHQYQLKVCFHIEPFKDRNDATLYKNIKHIIDKYHSHPAFFRKQHDGVSLPLFYMYDSYLVSTEQWSNLLKLGGELSVRNTLYDAIFVGLLVEEKHRSDLKNAGFDGFYTYFASDGFTFGSSSRNWAGLANYAETSDMFFAPSVGPGYVDTRVRPWNTENTKNREHGGYYEQSFRAAITAHPSWITITSFNEWHEGTQIEKAVPKHANGFTYMNYLPQEPNYYLSLTRKWVLKFTQQQKAQSAPNKG